MVFSVVSVIKDLPVGPGVPFITYVGTEDIEVTKALERTGHKVLYVHP